MTIHLISNTWLYYVKLDSMGNPNERFIDDAIVYDSLR